MSQDIEQDGEDLERQSEDTQYTGFSKQGKLDSINDKNEDF